MFGKGEGYYEQHCKQIATTDLRMESQGPAATSALSRERLAIRSSDTSKVSPPNTAVEANANGNATQCGKGTDRHSQGSFSVGEMADGAPAPKRRRMDSLGSWTGTGATAPTDTAPPDLTDVCNGIGFLSDRGAGALNRAAKPSGNAANAS